MAVEKANPSGTVTICPECEGADVYERSKPTDDPSEPIPVGQTDFCCVTCGHDFDTPLERERMGGDR